MKYGHSYSGYIRTSGESHGHIPSEKNFAPPRPPATAPAPEPAAVTTMGVARHGEWMRMGKWVKGGNLQKAGWNRQNVG